MTETTQPDPQVGAWMRRYLWAHPEAYAVDVNEAYYLDHPDNDLTSRDFLQALRAAKQPLTVADIPAGQGPASLFLVPDGDDYDLRFKYADGRTMRADLELGTLSNIFIAAVRDHLAATLPHVTTEDGA